jgi:membrane protein insertase Oxa1/YidC/SpoIIIJ
MELTIISSLFTALIYQPFFNLLLIIYWILGLFSQTQPDMGIAVIILTVIIRIILLPLSLAGHKSEGERREIAQQVKEVEAEYHDDPITLRQKRKQIFHKSRGVVFSEMLSLFIQVITALMLWRIFAQGLAGQDLHLTYSFMPRIDFPFNLTFLGRFDLAHTSLALNFLQSFLIFVLETISMYTSPYPPSKGEVVRLQLTLPVLSFVIFMGLPAGKKLFVITTLIFSIVLTIVKLIRRKFLEYKDRKVAEELAADSNQEQLVVQ